MIETIIFVVLVVGSGVLVANAFVGEFTVIETIIFVVLVVGSGVLVANAFVGWPGPRPWLKMIRVDQVDGEFEVELSNGKVFRSASGNWWVRFPDGARANMGLNDWLADEFDRFRNIDRWAE